MMGSKMTSKNVDRCQYLLLTVFWLALIVHTGLALAS